MKSTIVPAQVTDIEDRVTGSLSLTQLGLLVLPVFIGLTLYLLPPDSMHMDTAKLVTGFLFSLMCLLSAIRFKKQIIAVWMALLLRYLLKPKVYVFDKNFCRSRIEKEAMEYIKSPTTKTASKPAPVQKQAYLLSELKVNLIKTKKGGPDVHITEAA